MRFATESRPQLAIPRNVLLAGSADVKPGRDAGGEYLARRHGVERDPEHPGEVVAASAGQDPQNAVGPAQRSRERGDESVAAERDGDMAVGVGAPCAARRLRRNS